MTPDLPTGIDRNEFPFTPRLVDLGQGEALSVTDTGQGPVLLFSHGTPTWSYEWRHLMRALSPTHRCIAPDHLGFGLSPRPAGADYRPEAHAARFARLIEALGLERVTLLVHDFGGPFALDAALEHPEKVERLVVFNSFAWPFATTRIERMMARMLGGALMRWFYRRFNMSFVISRSAWGDRKTMSAATWDPYVPRFPDPDSRERVLFALARSMLGSEEYFASLEKRLDRLAAKPIHLVWGMADPAFTPVHLARFRRHWPRATTLELPGVGHWPHLERPTECVTSVTHFLTP